MTSEEFPPVFAHAFDITAAAQADLLPANARLEHALSNSTAKGLPEIAIAPQQGKLLQLLCKLTSAEKILEIGTLGGYSTIWFAESSPTAQVTGLEINQRHADVARENFGELNERIDIRVGAALELLPVLKDEGKVFDFVFIDASWDEQEEYFKWAEKLTRKGGIIYVDNVIRQLTDEEGYAKGRELVNFVKKAEEEGRVECSLIPTCSTHKRRLDEMVDGFLIARVK